MAQISCSFKLLSRYWKQGCPVFLLVERDFSFFQGCFGSGGPQDGGCSEEQDAWEFQRWGRAARARGVILSNFWQITLQAWIMEGGLKLLFKNYFSSDFSFPEAFFLQSQALFPPNPCSSPTGWGHRFGSNQTQVGKFISLCKSLQCFQRIFLFCFGEKKKSLGWDPCKALLCSAKIQELQPFCGTAQRMSMCLISYPWDKNPGKFPVEPLGCVLSPPHVHKVMVEWRDFG